MVVECEELLRKSLNIFNERKKVIDKKKQNSIAFLFMFPNAIIKNINIAIFFK